MSIIAKRHSLEYAATLPHCVDLNTGRWVPEAILPSDSQKQPRIVSDTFLPRTSQDTPAPRPHHDAHNALPTIFETPHIVHDLVSTPRPFPKGIYMEQPFSDTGTDQADNRGADRAWCSSQKRRISAALVALV